MSDTSSETCSISSRNDSADDESQSEEEMEVFSQVEACGFEPLASDEDDAADSEEDADVDGLTPDILRQRCENEIQVGAWCRCGKCSTEHLVGALEYRCCSEVQHTIGMLGFDGSKERVSCIAEHEDYSALNNKTVLLQVAPLLRGKDGRSYRNKNGVSQNELLRAVGYRWIVRWLCGYMGWDNCRPLPACVYHNIMNKFKSNQEAGYKTSQERE